MYDDGRRVGVVGGLRCFRVTWTYL